MVQTGKHEKWNRLFRFSERSGEMNRVWGHFRTITHHKRLVMQGCFRVGLYWQGTFFSCMAWSPIPSPLSKLHRRLDSL